MLKLAGILLGFLLPIAAAAETITITNPSPTAGQVITNGCIQVFAVAESDVGAKIAGWQIFIDGVATSFKAPNTSRINTTFCVPSVSIGNHSVQIRAWSTNQISGETPLVNVTISGTYKIVAPSDEAMSPVNGQSFNNGLIRVATSVVSPYQLTTWIVYVDDKRVFTSYEQAVQVKTDLPVSVGTHTVIVKVWDVNQKMATYTASHVVVTKGSMNVPPFVQPPSNAAILKNIDDKGALSGAVKWHGPFTGAAASCRGADLVCAAKAPVAKADAIQFVATPKPLPPASDGKAAQFQVLAGTEPYGNAGYSTAIFDDHPTRVNYVSDMWVMLTSTNIQTLELDLSASVGGKEFMMGTQCDFASGHWDFWDDTPAVLPAHPHWQKVFPTLENNDLVCNIQPNQWTHLRFNMYHDATSYHFVSLEINGVNHSLAELPPSQTTRKRASNGTAVQVQLDANNTATPVSAYIDNFNITNW